MVKKLIDCIDSGQRVADFKITLLHALKMARAAWDRVTRATIANCFRKGGFVTNTEEQEAEEEREDVSLISLCVGEPCTFMEYSMVDNNLSIAPSLWNADIVALVRHDNTDGEEDDDTGDPLPKVTSQQAFWDIQTYLLCHGRDADQSYRILRNLEILLCFCLITDFSPNV